MKSAVLLKETSSHTIKSNPQVQDQERIVTNNDGSGPSDFYTSLTEWGVVDATIQVLREKGIHSYDELLDLNGQVSRFIKMGISTKQAEILIGASEFGLDSLSRSASVEQAVLRPSRERVTEIKSRPPKKKAGKSPWHKRVKASISV